MFVSERESLSWLQDKRRICILPLFLSSLSGVCEVIKKENNNNNNSDNKKASSTNNEVTGEARN